MLVLSHIFPFKCTVVLFHLILADELEEEEKKHSKTFTWHFGAFAFPKNADDRFKINLEINLDSSAQIFLLKVQLCILKDKQHVKLESRLSSPDFVFCTCTGEKQGCGTWIFYAVPHHLLYLADLPLGSREGLLSITLIKFGTLKCFSCFVCYVFSVFLAFLTLAF